MISYKIQYCEVQDIESIKKIFSQEGSMTGNVLKFTFPRYDLMVIIDNIMLEPEMALTSWVAFDQLGNKSIMMGDLVLLEYEIESVISYLLKNGIEATALHNHLLLESPKVMYLHIKGIGEPIKLAQSVKNALSLTTTPLEVNQQPLSRIDWSSLENFFGRKGSYKGNVLQLSFSRNVIITDEGYQLSPAMGISHGINFQYLGDKIAVTGDFVLLENEVNPIAQILNQNNISVTALHNHMLTENPRLFFMHFWAVNILEDLAQPLWSVINLAS
jgi:hypothetical protein